MKKRTVIVRPHIDDDAIRDLVRVGRAMKASDTASVESVVLAFSAPASGWMRFDISTGGHSADWDLAYSPDPFSTRRERHARGYCRTFLSWLEDIAAGGSSALGIDMEGPVGALVILENENAPFVTLLALTGPDRLDFAVRIARRSLVRDVYSALLAYWSSDTLNAAWSEWSQQPKWNLRSAAVEDYLA